MTHRGPFQPQTFCDSVTLSAALRDRIPQPSCVLCTHPRDRTRPPRLQCWAHPPHTCGRTRSAHTTASHPHACIFSHAKTTRHTHRVKQTGRGQEGMRHATYTDPQPLPRPHLKHSRKASKHCAKWSIVYLAAPFPRLSDGIGHSGGTLLLQHQLLHPEPLVWSTGAEATSLHDWGSPLTTVQAAEKYKSHRGSIKRKTLSSYQAANE